MSTQQPPTDPDDQRPGGPHPGGQGLEGQGLDGTDPQAGSPFAGEPPLGAASSTDPADVAGDRTAASPTGQQPASNQWQPGDSGASTVVPPAGPPPAANGFGIAALVLGIVGLAVSWIPFFGFAGVVIGLVGVCLGVVGLVMQRYQGQRTLAIVGTTLSTLALLLSMILPLITGIFFIVDRLDRNGDFDRMNEEWRQEWEDEFDRRDEDWHRHTTEPTLAPSPTAPETFDPTATPESTQVPTESPTPTP